MGMLFTETERKAGDRAEGKMEENYVCMWRVGDILGEPTEMSRKQPEIRKLKEREELKTIIWSYIIT